MKKLLLFIVFIQSVVLGQVNYEFEIENASGNKKDSAFINAIQHYSESNVNKALSYVQEFLIHTNKTENTTGKAIAYKYLSILNFEINDKSLGIKYNDLAVQIFEDNKEYLNAALTKLKLGVFYIEKSEFNVAVKVLLEGLDFANKASSIKTQALLNNYIGVAYDYQEMYDEALIYYSRSLVTYKDLNDSTGISNSFNNIGIVYDLQEKWDSAIYYYELSYSIDSLMNYELGVAGSKTNIGLINQTKGEYSKSLQLFKEAFGVYKKNNDTYGTAILLNNLADLYKERNMLDSALYYMYQGLDYSKKTKQVRQLIDNYEITASIFKQKGDIDSDLFYTEKYIELKDSTNKALKSQEIADMKERYESSKKQLEIEKLNSEKKEIQISDELKEKRLKLEEANRKSQQIIYLVITVVLLLAVLFFFHRNNSRKLNNEKLSILNNQLAIKNKDITDSIVYAKRIQEAVLPSKKAIANSFTESFVLFLPRDIVSGDFYWFFEKGDKVFIAVADATGHGVPGAFVSMLCHNTMSQAIIENNLENPGKILSYVHQHVINGLRTEGKEVKANDGMDVCLVVMDKKENTIEFSGAMNDLIRISENNLYTHKANRVSIGGYTDYNYLFKSETIQLKKDDKFYLYTDGFADQFGGPLDKKFKLKRLKDLIFKNSSYNFSEQHQILEKTHNDWKKDIEQLDDISVIGFKI